jgi:hypothetical protein
VAECEVGFVAFRRKGSIRRGVVSEKVGVVRRRESSTFRFHSGNSHYESSTMPVRSTYVVSQPVQTFV